VRTQARFPHLEHGAGHYESFYVKACRPEGGLGVWIRHTIHKRPNTEPTGSIWFTLFDAEGPAPQAGKATFPAGELSAGNGAYVRIDGAKLEPETVTGALRSKTLEASWELSFTDPGGPFHHLPYGWMYRAPLPRTKFLSPYPAARFSGEVEVAGGRIELEGWPGMIGHNWGAEHAERWTWIQGTGFAGGGEGDYLDIAAGRIKLGRWTTPWVGNGVLVLDGTEHRLGGLDRVRGTRITDRPTSCDFLLPGNGISVSGRVRAEPRKFVGWIYADPKGPDHNTLNCSISDLELTVERDGQAPRRLELRGGAAYEIGMRETDHGIPLQPYSDGELEPAARAPDPAPS
jgi:hypothetical protein